MSGINPQMASFGAVDMSKVAAKAADRPQAPSKYRDFMDAIHSVSFSEKNIDQQTELEWINIEGEVLGVVLVDDLISGTMMKPVRNRLFRFKSPQKQLDELFVTKFIETVNRHPKLVPAITTGKQKLNELMVSYLRHGRIELVEMVRAFQIQLQDTQSDPNKILRR
jgi:hypothetical protein